MPRIRVLLWTRRSRETILQKIDALIPEGYKRIMEPLSSVIDELSKNAIKANHKHLIIRQRIKSKIEAQNPGTDATKSLESICGVTDVYNNYLQTNPEMMEGLTEGLSRILRQEAVWIDMRNKQKKSRHDFTPEEIEKLRYTSEFKSIYSEVRNRRTYVEIRGSRTGDMLFLEVINNAPIMSRDLQRIEDKRSLFKKHREAGTEYEFFLNAMDNSDGGSGLGYATIDSHLADLGLDPQECLRIISLHSTNAMLNIDMGLMGNG